MIKEISGSDDLALLTRMERDGLLANPKVSKSTTRDLRYRIRKNPNVFQNQERDDSY
jgi:hypothetical protein